MKCEKCSAKIADKKEAYEHLGKSLCEDCYMDAHKSPQKCGPREGDSAKSTG